MKILSNDVFPQENFETIDIENLLNEGRRIIENIQKGDYTEGECYLTFSPVSKNVRFISSDFFRSIVNNKKPGISLDPRPGEAGHLLQMIGENWYPWLWSRCYEKNSNNLESWCNLFLDISEEVKPQDLPKPGDFHTFFLYLACLEHTFRINPEMEKNIKDQYFNYEWPDLPVCGLQIRRGELVPKDGDIGKGWNGRPLYSLDDYMHKARLMCENLNTNYIFISTDSKEAVEYLVGKYPEYNFLTNGYDRNLFIRYNGGGAYLELESDLRKDPNIIKHYTESCISDLLALSMCQGYVGGMTWSEYGICGWFLQMVKQKKITPYINIEGTLDLNGASVGMLLK